MLDLLMTELPTAALFCLVCFLVFKLYNQSTFGKGVRRPKCVPFLPVIGSLPFMNITDSPLPVSLMKHSTRYGNVFAFYSGSRYELSG